jgi:hypothetical protein
MPGNTEAKKSLLAAFSQPHQHEKKQGRVETARRFVRCLSKVGRLYRSLFISLVRRDRLCQNAIAADRLLSESDPYWNWDCWVENHILSADSSHWKSHTG